MSTSAGQKVKDANAPALSEGTGTVTSDSLAAESVKNDGSFAAGNPKVGLTGQSSAGSTVNTTDTSAARKLDPASDSEARAAQQEWSEQGQLNAGLALGKDASNVDTAPSAFTAGKLHEKNQKPHGKNITEGGFAEHAPNASFNNEIGTINDPGRLGEKDLRAQQSGAHAAAPKDGKSTSGDTPYNVLGETSA